MSGLFSKPKPPQILMQPAREAPKIEEKAVQSAGAEALRRRQRARGFRSTIVGGLLGEGGAEGLQRTLGS